MKYVKPILSAAISAITVSCLMTGCRESGEQAAGAGIANTASEAAQTVNINMIDKLTAAAGNADAADDASSTMITGGYTLDTPTAEDLAAIKETAQSYEEQKTKYGKMLPDDYTDIPQEATYGIMTDIDGLMVSHMKYFDDNGKPNVYTDHEGKKTATLDFLYTQDAKIVFENGSPASEEDLTPGTAVMVEYDWVEETYPGNMRCTKIVIRE